MSPQEKAKQTLAKAAMNSSAVALFVKIWGQEAAERLLLPSLLSWEDAHLKDLSDTPETKVGSVYWFRNWQEMKRQRDEAAELIDKIDKSLSGTLPITYEIKQMCKTFLAQLEKK